MAEAVGIGMREATVLPRAKLRDDLLVVRGGASNGVPFRGREQSETMFLVVMRI